MSVALIVRSSLRSVLTANHTIVRTNYPATVQNNMAVLDKLRRRMSGMGVAKGNTAGEQSAAAPALDVAAPKQVAESPAPAPKQVAESTAPAPPAKDNVAAAASTPTQDTAASAATTDASTATAPATTDASTANAPTATQPESTPTDATTPPAAVPESHNYLPKDKLRTLYPPVEAFKTGMLPVDDEHTLYWEASGNANGVPVVFLHGGPGGACSPSDRRWFDPEHYCIYLVDQRGSGKSTPHASLNNNTTWSLVSDVEALREHVGVARWHVFGGSWGSCLALAYSQKHPDRVLSLVLRGIFTLRRSELLFFYQDGTSHLFPEYFAPYRNHIPADEQDDLMAAYYKRLTSDDEAVQIEAAKHWSTWENATCKLYVDEEQVRKAEDDAKWALAFARIECHFFVNRGWMDDGALLKRENVDKIRHVPATIVQGRYDAVCPAKTAFDLHKEWPEAAFHIVPDSGHASREIGIANLLIQATDKMREIKA